MTQGPKIMMNYSHSVVGKKVNSFKALIPGPKCQLCINENHIIRKCPKFLKIDLSQRFKKIKKEGLCINCFLKTHTVKNCPSKHRCFKCNKKHNTLLHKDPVNSNPISSDLKPNSAPFSSSSSTPIQSTTSSNVIQSCFSSNATGVLLGTAWVNVLHSGLTYTARALIDSGSEGTFISERLFNILKLPFKNTSVQISGLNNSVFAGIRRECSFLLGTPLNPNLQISVTALVVTEFAANLPSCTIPNSVFSDLPEIQLADPKFYSSSKIDILIEGDIFQSIICSGIKHNICGSLIAQKTIFGWILTGPVDISCNSKSTIISYFCEISLDKEISRFWEVENLPQKNFMSPSDQACENLYKQSTYRLPEGRYVVSLPFKEELREQNNLGYSRDRAVAQFFRNEARLLRLPDLKSEYDRVI